MKKPHCLCGKCGACKTRRYRYRRHDLLTLPSPIRTPFEPPSPGSSWQAMNEFTFYLRCPLPRNGRVMPYPSLGD